MGSDLAENESREDDVSVACSEEYPPLFMDPSHWLMAGTRRPGPQSIFDLSPTRPR